MTREVELKDIKEEAREDSLVGRPLEKELRLNRKRGMSVGRMLGGRISRVPVLSKETFRAFCLCASC
jgi:hypothetical protein